MKSPVPFVQMFLFGLLAIALAVAWPGGALMHGGGLDLMLVVAVMVSAFVRPGVAAAVGFSVALIQGGLAGADMSQLMMSRVIACFAMSMVCFRETPPHVVSRAILGAGTVLITGLLHMFLAPPPSLGPFLIRLIASTVPALAICVYFSWLWQRHFFRRFM